MTTSDMVPMQTQYDDSTMTPTVIVQFKMFPIRYKCYETLDRTYL